MSKNLCKHLSYGNLDKAPGFWAVITFLHSQPNPTRSFLKANPEKKQKNIDLHCLIWVIFVQCIAERKCLTKTNPCFCWKGPWPEKKTCWSFKLGTYLPFIAPFLAEFATTDRQGNREPRHHHLPFIHLCGNHQRPRGTQAEGGRGEGKRRKDLHGRYVFSQSIERSFSFENLRGKMWLLNKDTSKRFMI